MITEKPSSSARGRFERASRLLASRQLALGLFLFFCLSLVPGTFEKTVFHFSTLSRVLLGCLALNLAVCSLLRIKTLAKPVLIIHAGVILTLAGGLISSFGYTATVNMYEGTTVDTAYRWDRGQDVPLGFTLTVKNIETQYYPVPVKVGVLKGTARFGLFILKTGESFPLEGYTVKAETLDLPAGILKLTVFQGDRVIGSTDTEGTREVASSFPYEFKLVAYKTPSFKRVRVGLALAGASGVIAEGITEVNSPFEWNGLSFHNTRLETDPYGVRYAGIQIIRDPGKEVVYAGFGVIMAGSLLWMYRKLWRGPAVAAKSKELD